MWRRFLPEAKGAASPLFSPAHIQGGRIQDAGGPPKGAFFPGPATGANLLFELFDNEALKLRVYRTIVIVRVNVSPSAESR